MNPENSESSLPPLDLVRVVREMVPELCCLLGPSIRLATGQLATGGPATVRADQEEIVDLLRHLALDAHDAMPAGGTVTIRTGRLPEAAECAAMVLHEMPDASAAEEDNADDRISKGRSLGLGASFDSIHRVGGHFHVSCRGRETVLTICFPLAS